MSRIKLPDYILLIGLILFGLLFRLVKLNSLQYWSDDEQLLWAIMRHIIVDTHPSLITPNVAVGVGLGPIFHYLLIPWYFLTKLDPEKILLLGNFFFVVNTTLIYATGKLVGGKKAAFISAFLYVISFISSLFDRRLWALSPNFSLMCLGIISLINTIKGNSKFLVLLTIPIIFAFNSDPSLGVMVLASILALILFRPKIEKGHLLYSTVLLLIFFLPLVVFEFRHNGQNLKSIIKITTENKISSPTQKGGNLIYSQFTNFSRFFWAKGTKAADAYFCYCELDDKINPLATFTVATFVVFFLATSLKTKNKKYIILSIVIFSYFIGIIIFKSLFGGKPYFFYSLTISPVIFLAAGVILSRKRLLSLFLLLTLLAANTYSLINSEFKYPLKGKEEVVKEVISLLPSKDFSLYYSGDIILSGGGWTSLFMQKGYYPKKGSLSLYWGHTYLSYNLYPFQFSNSDPRYVVVLSENAPDIKDNKIILSQGGVGKVFFRIYNNEGGWFNSVANIEELYQPKYFK